MPIEYIDNPGTGGRAEFESIIDLNAVFRQLQNPQSLLSKFAKRVQDQIIRGTAPIVVNPRMRKCLDLDNNIVYDIFV